MSSSLSQSHSLSPSRFTSRSSPMASLSVAIFVFFVLNLASLQAFAGVVLEEGYTVTTLIDGHKLDINPYSVLPRPGSSDLLVLDSFGSAFYTVSLPASKSQENVVKKLSGAGGEGYSDGESVLARFKKPRGFAVDLKGTVFVADRSNNVIRKISASGVSTIAGGYSLKPGHEDGPAQNATFSSDFDLAFDADRCALLVSDRGNQLVRLISLKPEDCARGSAPSALGSVSVWIMSLGLSCFVGIVVGLVARPCIMPYEGSSQLGFSVTWKRCQISLGKQAQTFCFAIRSATASSSTPVLSLLRRLFWLCVSQISLMFSISSVESRVSSKEGVSLLDLDVNNSSSTITESSKYVDQLKDLMLLDGSTELSSADNLMLKQDGNAGRSDVLSGCHGGIDDMIDSNFMGFVDGALGGSSGLVKRR